MCCDGTLFGSVSIVLGDRLGPLHEAGAVPLAASEGTLISQPCAAHSGTYCTVYASRPEICRTYRCALLKSVDNHEVSHDDAVEVIRRATTLRDRVQAGLAVALGQHPKQPFSNAYSLLSQKFANEGDPVAAARIHADLLFDIVSLRTLLDNQFEIPGSES